MVLNQEKSLEELQKHLHKTEELFRESVKRKNQQLDLLQSEVRRLKTNAIGREQQANDQVDRSLVAQSAEVERLKQQLARRETEVDALAAQVSQLKATLSEERGLRQEEASRAEEASTIRARVREQDEQLQQVRDSLAAAQANVMRLEGANAEGEILLQERDAELKRLRSREQATEQAHAEAGILERELELLHDRLKRREDELEKARMQNSELVANDETAQQALEVAELAKTALEAELRTALASTEEAREMHQQAEAAAQAAEQQLQVQANEIAELRYALESSKHQMQLQQEEQHHEQQELQLQLEMQQQRQRAHGAAQEHGDQVDMRQVRKTPAIPRAPESAALPAYPNSSSDQILPARADPVARAGAACRSSTSSAQRDESPYNEQATGTMESHEQVSHELQLVGEPIMGGSLVAQIGLSPAADKCAIQWFRDGNQRPERSARYLLTAADVGFIISVRVTFAGADSNAGITQSASCSAVAVPHDLPERLQEMLDKGDKTFDRCIEQSNGDKERIVLFTREKKSAGGKIKVRDRAGKTWVKDAFSAARIDLAPDDDLTFTLVLTGKKGATLQMRAPHQFTRDLIYLTLQAFTNPAFVSTLPRGKSGLTTASALQLGQGTLDQGAISPVSSVTSEVPPDPAGVADAVTAAKLGKGKLGKTLSFGRKKSVR
eukprot:CAMPEP_0119304858 /NCGR_PEP_ID=MMETSP1333-20130426/5976_1 /TAXON_ID=418940 /ORGANISM="Scyphosphaera apsteinii, Strain RCC1455" /LENGTH=669 /DNA_ID=CAMNT_0007307811 /DNA_START=41 /DNA_END=2050 /DNA_ORIENTATION=-